MAAKNYFCHLPVWSYQIEGQKRKNNDDGFAQNKSNIIQQKNKCSQLKGQEYGKNNWRSKSKRGRG